MKSVVRIFCGLVILGFLISPLPSYAQTNNPFGGLVNFKFYCNCSGNYLVGVLPPLSILPKLLTFRPGQTIEYEFRKVEIGQHILGTWETTQMCMIHVPGGCAGKPFPFMYMVGTSGGKVDDVPPEPIKPQCDDGVDNDGDGGIDMEDPGCESPEDDNEDSPECSDGLDNDDDDLIDYPDDKGCASEEDDRESDAPCACNCDGEEEQETRDKLAELGIGVNKGACPRNNEDDPCQSTTTGGGGYSCTDVRCLPMGVVNKLGQLKSESGCSIMITGGTEPGHKSHGQCKAVTDLRWESNSCLNNYIRGGATGTSGGVNVIYTVPGYGRFMDEQPRNGTRHWHVWWN